MLCYVYITGKSYYYGQLHAHCRSRACHMHALHLLDQVHACVIHAFASDYYSRMMMVIFFKHAVCML